MKYITKRIRITLLLAFSAMMILSSCNKDVEQIAAPAPVVQSGLALGETIATIANDSLYYKLIVKSGLLATINNKPTYFTMFVPDNAAMRTFINAISGGATIGFTDAQYVAFINSANVPAATAASIVAYNMCPQTITTSSIPGTFPNFFYPTHLNPTSGPTFNPLVRLLTFPSTRNGNWVNNVPLSTVNQAAANGVIHTATFVPAPPSKVLYQRIAADPDMTIFNAAITRADSGVSPTTSASLIWALSNFGPNLTVFAPTNASFKALISALTGGLIPIGAPDANFIAFLGSNSVTTQTVKGIVVYHMMGTRAFLNNFPTTATSYPTLLNGAVPTHPGVSIVATFTGGIVTGATIKGAANATASVITVTPFIPEPSGTSDQQYVNGTLHKINQVLLPQ